MRPNGPVVSTPAVRRVLDWHRQHDVLLASTAAEATDAPGQPRDDDEAAPRA